METGHADCGLLFRRLLRFGEGLKVRPIDMNESVVEDVHTSLIGFLMPSLTSKMATLSSSGTGLSLKSRLKVGWRVKGLI
jgi:hypothetical protein